MSKKACCSLVRVHSQSAIPVTCFSGVCWLSAYVHSCSILQPTVWSAQDTPGHLSGRHARHSSNAARCDVRISLHTCGSPDHGTRCSAQMTYPLRAGPHIHQPVPSGGRCGGTMGASIGARDLRLGAVRLHSNGEHVQHACLRVPGRER